VNVSLATTLATMLTLGVNTSLAYAQTRPSDRPYRALFGRGHQGTTGHNIDVSATLSQAYDDDLFADAGSVSPGGAVVSGQYTMLQTAADYAWSTQRLQLGITGASAFKYYAQGADIQSVSHSGGIGMSVAVRNRTQLALNASGAYSPSYLSNLFPSVEDARLGDAQPVNPNYAVNDVASYSYVARGALSQAVTARGTLHVTGNYTFTDFFGGAPTRPDGASYGGRVQFARRFGRHSSGSVGYRYQSGDFGLVAGGTSTDNGIDFGIEHTKVLSATRTARFSFGLGTSRATLPPQFTSSDGSLTGAQQLYRVTGNAALSYEFSRTGQLALSYRRGVEYILQLAQPVFIDAINVSAGASLSRRMDLTFGAGYSSGASVLQQSSQFDTYTGDVRSTIVLTNRLSAYLEYLYYFYDFGSSGLLAPGLPQKQARNGIRAGLTLSTPLLRR
jgi:hypothetical protein